MTSAEDVAAAQAFYNTMDDYSIQRDPVLQLFKRNELDATVAAASTGKYYDFWTIEKVGDLNNLVDANPSCHPDMKALFGPNAAKNARLKAAKIGKLVLDRVLEMKKNDPSGGSSGGGGGMGGGAAAPAPSFSSAPAPASPRPTTGKAAAAAVGGGAGWSAQPAVRMQRYVFAPGLPADCRLRVRSAPQTDSEELGVVTPEDEIYATAQQGDWIRVHLADGAGKEAWMLVATANQLLLVPSDEPPVVTSTFAPESLNMSQVHQAQPLQQQQQQMLPPRMAMGSAPMHSSLSMSAFPSQQSMSAGMANMSLSGGGGFGQFGGGLGVQSFNDTARSLGGGDPGEPVSYAAFKMLERRVSMLEAELQHLRALLRSV